MSIARESLLMGDGHAIPPTESSQPISHYTETQWGKSRDNRNYNYRYKGKKTILTESKPLKYKFN